jgi:hypothetical protein
VAILKDPTHFKAYFNRGFSYDKLGDYERWEIEVLAEAN